MTKQRIVHLDFSGHGVMTHVLSILDNADHEKWEHHVIYATDDNRPGINAYRQELASRNIPGYEVPNLQHINPADLGAALKTWGMVRRLRPQIVHCHSTKAGAIGRTSALLSGRIPSLYTPNAFSFHTADKNSRRYTVLVTAERLLGKITDRLITVSDTEYALALQERICPPERTVLLRNSIDSRLSDRAIAERAATRESLGLAKDEIAICFIGRFAAQKMPHMVVEAAAALAKQGKRPTFLLLGNGPLEDEVRALAKTREVDAQFKWLGWKPYEEGIKILAAADMMVLPSRYEGLPYVALEAQSVGTVPIMTRVPGSQDAVLDNETGYLVAFEDADAIATAMHDLIADPEKRAKMSEAGKLYIRSKFDAAGMVSALHGVYQDLIFSHGKAPAKSVAR